jgi:tetratricopeptide (TPR) repeat protein/tRNA A-37 threonylcarbamoyl transferase component Bud32
MADVTRHDTVKIDVVLAGAETTVHRRDVETVAESAWPRYAQPALGEFGNYELLSKLGEGGMGIVYRARQKGADRIVALKVVHTNRAGSSREATRAKALERFRIEAQAAAKLEHENIVPVYDVGEIGEHLYFSMRLVEGQSLNEVIRNQPLDQRQAAKYLVGIARGVAAAHRKGILHRDLKPHNVMLDESIDRPLVADFGLAKVVEADDQVTRTGEVIGTPSYMPPEQISSAATVDARADIYALGATLYHLVVGKPPFQAANTLATMRQVLYQEPVAPRELNESLDLDLDTICVKCLQKEPAKRYATADELADDLERYLAGKPIAARPISRPERVVRWARRNPLPAALTGLAGALAVCVFAAIAIGYVTTSAALANSERNFEIARDSIDELYTEVADIDLENAPGMQPLKEKLLTRSLAYYERLIAEHEKDGALTADFAANQFRVGVILDQLGKTADAGPHYEEAKRIQAELLAADPSNADLQIELSDTWNELGRVAQRSGDLAAAEKAFREAERLRIALVDADGDNIEFQRKLANIRMNLGLLAVRNKDFDAAQALYDDAQSVRMALLEKEKNTRVLEDLAKGLFNQGALLMQREEFAKAVAPLREAIAKFEELLAGEPTSLKYRSRLAVAQSTLADVLQLNGQYDGALAVYADGQGNLQVLVDENPLVEQFQEQLTTLQIGQAQLELNVGHELAKHAVAGGDGAEDAAAASETHFKQCESLLLSAEERLRKQLDRNDAVATTRLNLARVLQVLGDVRLAFQDIAGARSRFQAALDELNALPADAAASPTASELRTSIEQSLNDALAAGEA